LRPFVSLLRGNRNYRFTWIGQVVSEVGDHFNNIAVFSLAVAATHSGMTIALIFLARAVSAVVAGPLAGVALDRFDRKQLMIASDLVRGIVAAGFIFVDQDHPDLRLVYLLSALLMLASPFFTAGRASILPDIATRDELHTANSLTQMTQWTTLTAGALLAGSSAAAFGYQWAFGFNSLSFFVSALCISRLALPGRGFQPPGPRHASEAVRPWHEYAEGLRYIRGVPLVLGLLLVNVGWATGGGAAQILFTVFGEMVFKRGPAGLGTIWGFAGVGLLCGGAVAYRFGRTLSFKNYKRAIAVCYLVHGGAYVLFSRTPSFALALGYIALSRAGVGMSSVLNMSQLLRMVPNEFRGRVFATMESVTWSVSMVSMMLAGAASQSWNPRTIGTVAGILSSTTAIFWGVANSTGRLPEPARQGEIEVHGDSAA
jgi:MFS family permease